MQVPEPQPARLGFWTVLLLSVFAWGPTLYPGYWQALEGFVPVFNVLNPNAIVDVATNPDLWRGTGWSAFLPAQPLLLAGATPVAAVRANFALCIILGGLGVYVWLRPKLGDRGAGLAGMVYLLWPPLLATVYVRGSVADAVILALLPLALAGAASYAESRGVIAAAVLALSLLWMWRTQAGLAVFASLLLLLYVWRVERSRGAALVVGVSAVAGVTSLIPLRNITAAAPVLFGEHFVYPHQLLAVGWAVAPSIAGWQDAYPFQLGFAALVMGMAAVWLWRRDASLWAGSAPARLLAFCLAGSGVLVLLALPISGWLWTLTGAERLLTYPWQVLLLAGVLLAALAGSLPMLTTALAAPVYWAALITATVLASYPYLTTNFTQAPPPSAPVATFGANNDVALLAAKLTEDRAAGEAKLDVTWQTLRPLPFDYSVFFQAIAPGADGDQVVGQLDTQPRDGARPATTWGVGEIITDTYTLQMDGNVAAPELHYYFGYYDWRDGARLPVNDGLDDKVILAGARQANGAGE